MAIPYRAGGRVRLKYWGGNVPRWLVGELGTIKKVNRTRVEVVFDTEKPGLTPRIVPKNFLVPIV